MSINVNEDMQETLFKIHPDLSLQYVQINLETFRIKFDFKEPENRVMSHLVHVIRNFSNFEIDNLSKLCTQNSVSLEDLRENGLLTAKNSRLLKELASWANTKAIAQKDLSQIDHDDFTEMWVVPGHGKTSLARILVLTSIVLTARPLFPSAPSSHDDKTAAFRAISCAARLIDILTIDPTKALLVETDLAEALDKVLAASKPGLEPR